MNRETVAFALPLVTLGIGMLVLLAGIFQGGLTTLTFIGGAIAALGIVLLAFSVFQAH